MSFSDVFHIPIMGEALREGKDHAHKVAILDYL